MDTGKLIKSIESGNFKIRNMLTSMERTFLPVGSRIGKYRIIEEIDRGGMAVVYRALQQDLDREVALKVMPANITINPKFVDRFLSEAHAIAKLSHPNIVNIHEVAMENNIYYLAMDYIPGKNLYYYLHYYKPKLVDVLQIICKLTDALGYAHEQKIIHRDLKLNNVIMRDRETPVLIDFGLAKTMEDDTADGITRTGEIMGSPSYMAPERLLGGIVDHRSDICSLGIMLYEMLTFKNPYLDQRNLHQTTINVMESNPIPPRKLVPWLPPEIEAITLKAMAKDPNLRYASMEDFKADILRYKRGDPVIARPPSLLWHIKRFTKRYWAPLSIIGIILTFTGLFMATMYNQTKKEQSHWQLIYTSKFNSKNEGLGWVKDTAWIMKNGAIQCQTDEFSFAKLDRRLNRDILIEFDIKPNKGNLYNAGFFLFGNSPDSAYCFYLNKNGMGQYGISFPGNDFIFRETASEDIVIKNQNHVTIERIGNTITFTINDVTVAKVSDLLPPLGKNHEKAGFFIHNGAAVFDNLQIYRRAIPLIPSPTIIADRFLERGDVETALEEYRSLQLDFAATDYAKEIHVKTAECLIRLKKYEEALRVLEQSRILKSKNDNTLAHASFLERLIYTHLDKINKADSIFTKLSQHHSQSPATLASMNSSIIRLYSEIKSGSKKSIEKEINFLSGKYPRYRRIWGQLYLSLLKEYIRNDKIDSASILSDAIVKKYNKDNEIVGMVRSYMGYAYLDQGKKGKASEIFNQCISSHFSNAGVWDAWMGIAGIYEYDMNFNDALTIYQKVYRECPHSLFVSWMAAVKIGELSLRDTNNLSDKKIFKEIMNSNTFFPHPKLISAFYCDSISNSEFKQNWIKLYPNDNFYLYHLARKAKCNKEDVVAKIYLKELKQNSLHTWNYFFVSKLLSRFDLW